MSDTWIRITDPGTRSHKSLSNINTYITTQQTENFDEALRHKTASVLKHLIM